jgi:myo-inositol 2-dehydrogenase / D-chiro-inositol 1-dehydrogenase
MSQDRIHDATSQSRREFLKQSAVLAAAAAPALSLARSAHAAGSDVIRLGMVGCGGRCTGAAVDALTADPAARLVAMTDLFADRVRNSRAAIQQAKGKQVTVDDAHCFSGIDGYKKVIDSVDVVLIACAAKFHPYYLLAGIEAGKHVFVEKPHGIDPAGIKMVTKAAALAKEKNLGILSGLQSRFHAGIRETMQRIHDGQIGEIVAIEENFIRGPYGSTNRPANVRELEVQYGNQYRFSWLCGDDVTQSLVHNLDRSTWAMKETPPVKCHGLGGRSTSQNLLGDVFDHHSVVYHYANGVRLYALCRTTFNCYDENSSVIMGSKGMAYPLSAQITGEKPWRFTGREESPYVAEHRAFLQSIRAGKPLNCGDYMARSTLVAIMGQLSCYSGKEVTWEQASTSDYFFAPKPQDCTWDMAPPTAPDEKGVYPVCATPGMTKNV